MIPDPRDDEWNRTEQTLIYIQIGTKQAVRSTASQN